MPKFRTAATAPGVIPATAVNFAGGEAFAQSPELELASILFTSFLQDQFYRSGNDAASRLVHLLGKVDPVFAAKAAILARHEFGMRSVTHLVAAELSPLLKGRPEAARFFYRIVRRPDDVCEILGAYLTRHGKKIPSRMKRGLGKALAGFGRYPLSKYKGEGSNLKLVDAVNLCHPPHTAPLKELVDGTLEAPDTWEVRITQAGNDPEAKRQAWGKLLAERKLGYLALLRNIRNVVKADPNFTPELCQQLLNAEAIHKSLVMPFQFLTAVKTLQATDLDPGAMRLILAALSTAIDLSLENVPKWDEPTLVCLDDSGSMTGSRDGKLSPAEIGGMFAVALAKRSNADLMLFSDRYQYFHYNPRDTALGILQSLPNHGGGTNFVGIFAAAHRAYDRIVILSDMQGWIGYHNPSKAFHHYRVKFACNPKVYSFDLGGLGTGMFPEKNVCAIAGFNGDAVFKTMDACENGPDGLLKMVHAVEL